LIETRLGRYHLAGAMDLRRLYVVANERKPGVLGALTDVKRWCQAHDVDAVTVEGLPPADAEGAVVLALGGDGTVLRAARLFARTAVPILGANLGSLGFLTQVAASEAPVALDRLLDGAYSIEDRMRLQYRADEASGTVLNDVVVTGVSPARFCEVELLWRDGGAAGCPGDGLILSTATGSTAYSLSAGGPIIVPPAACILATPHAVHRLGLRPIVFPPDEVLRVETRTPARLIADGDPIVELRPGQSVAVERSPLSTRLIRISGAPEFFSILVEKLNWPDHRKRRESA